jgi:type IV secretory pathway VirB2 component (pilin)
MRKFWIRSVRPKRLFLLTAAAVFLLLAADAAFGTQGASFLPFTSALDTLFQEIVGPVARGLLFIMIAAGLLLWAGSTQGSGLAFVGKSLIVLAIIGSIPAIIAALGIQTATL